MKYKTLTGTFVREQTRFLGDPHDTIVASIEVQDGDFQTVKGKEFSTWSGAQRAILVPKERYTFFGNPSSYRSRSGFQQSQFAYFGYCAEQNTETVERLQEMLLGRGFPRELACRLVHELGPQALRLVRKNPYFLMRYDRVGFKRCDLLWLELGLPPGRLKRQTLCLSNALDNRDGSLWIQSTDAETILRQQLTCAVPDPARAIALGRRAGLIATHWTDGLYGSIDDLDGDVQWITSGRVAELERETCRMLIASLDESVSWPDVQPEEGGLSDHQAEQLTIATESSIGCLVGGGGTGKTFTVAQLVKAIAKEFGGLGGILAVAPTGKAAVRMTEAFASEEVAIRGVTIHSALARSGGTFDCSTLIVDESSMIDSQLMHSLLKARQPGTRTLFVGDPYQLSPVGSGAPFRDMCHVLKVGKLTEIRRNAGTIALAGQEIRDGIDFSVNNELELPTRNLTHIQGADKQTAILKAIALAQEVFPDIDPIFEIQVLGVVNRRTDASVSELNEFLQEHFNGDAPTLAGTPFRPNDKVIQTSNSWMIPDAGWDDKFDANIVRNKAGQIYVANGEIGRVVSITSSGMTVELFNPTRFVRAFNTKVEEGSEEGLTGSQFVHAYAITTHKSQGSQWPVVIAVIDDSPAASRLMDRSLIYTMLTRASKACIIVGSVAKARWACKRASIDQRKTFLVELYREACSVAIH